MVTDKKRGAPLARRMAGAGLYIAVAAVSALVVVLAIWLSLVARRGRAVGTRGLVQRSRLTCPRCHETFNYDWVPGGSFTSVRLGKGRYMACPLCQKWSYFDIYDTMVARTEPPESNIVTVGPR
jgi:hypothetical protein